MKKLLKKNNSVFSALIFSLLLSLTACNMSTSETWQIDNLDEIGGHSVNVVGDPRVVDTDIGQAVQFDGDGDQLLVDNNPIGDAKEFTVEVIFKAAAGYPDNVAPRFIHIQDPQDQREKRLMIELRLNEENQCYLDAYLQTDTSSLVLIDENLVHPTEEWLHAAVSYKDGVMTTYMNGEKELTGNVEYADTIINPVGKVAIGGRMNQVSWYNGLVKSIKVTHAAIGPEEFTLPEN